MARKTLFALASVLALLFPFVSANAQFYNVDCTGADTYAYPNIASALAVATPNSSIFIEAGPCNENVSVQSQQALNLGAFWNQRVTINGSINIQGSQSLYLYGLDVTNTAGNGITVSDSRNVTLETCTSSGNSGTGLVVQGLSDVYVTVNGAFDRNGGGGISVADNSYLSLVAWGGLLDISYNTGYGLFAARGTFSGFGNTTISNTVSGWAVDLRGGATGNFGPVFGPNLIQNNSTGGVSLQENAEISFWNYSGASPNIIQFNGPFGVKAGLGSQVTFYDGTQISDHTGPGVDIYANSQVYFFGHNQVLRNGTVTDPLSAGIRIDGNSELLMRNGEISQNNGPAMLALVNSSLDFTGVTFSGNNGIVTCDSTATMISDLVPANLNPPAGVRCKVPHLLGNRRVQDFRPPVPDYSRLKALDAKYKKMATKH